MRRAAAIAALALVLVTASPAAPATYPIPGCHVPQLAGRTLAQAEQELTAANCSLGEVTAVVNTTEPVDRVIASSPEAGANRPSGAKVDLSISRSRTAPGAKCRVPRVTGLPLRRAVLALVLENCNSFDPEYEHSDTVASDEVIYSNPDEGTTHPVGTRVQLVVSAGRDRSRDPCRVPYVVGILKTEAEKFIVQNNCSVGGTASVRSDTEPIGIVISTRPVADTTHPRGTSVTLVVSGGRHFTGGSGANRHRRHHRHRHHR